MTGTELRVLPTPLPALSSGETIRTIDIRGITFFLYDVYTDLHIAIYIHILMYIYI